MQLTAHSHLTRINAEQAAIQAHQDAHNALSMALHHLRISGNVPGAIRKARQALQALSRLQGRA